MYLLTIFVTRQRSVSYVGLKKRVNSVTVQCQVTEMMKSFIAARKPVSDAFVQPSPTPLIREKVEKMIQHYLVENLEEVSPLQYWKLQDNDNLGDPVRMAFSDTAKKYLTPTASTVSVERLFSTAGDIITTERNRLLPENAKMILFIREALPLINFQY